tara:strand:+ start:286 stop:753 length:468 start_codon:yes stop_codon:yes gene_type:complete
MDLGTAFGLLLGIGLISIGIVSNNGNLMWFLNWNSLLIVVGRTFAATLVNYPLRNIQSLLKIASTAFTRQDIGQEDVIDKLVKKAEMSRKKGVLSLEKELPKVRDKFSAMGYGEFRPTSKNDTPEGRARNRRVEIYLDAFVMMEEVIIASLSPSP